MDDSSALYLQAQLDVWDAVVQGESVDLTVSVENAGDLAAEGVEVSIDLPFGLSATQTTEYIGSISGHSAYTSQFSIYCNEPGEHIVTVHVMASNAKSTTAKVSVWVLTPPDISLTAELSTDSIEEGESTTLIVKVANIGESPADNVEVSIHLPPGLSTTPSIRNIDRVSIADEVAFSIKGVTPGIYTIEIAVNAENAESKKTTIMLAVKAASPETTSETPLTTTLETTTPEVVTVTERETVKEETKGTFIPGFELVTVLLALPVVAWLWRRTR